MTLTKNEAEARARAIWGEEEVSRVEPAPSHDHWMVELAREDRQHFLDGNGHTTCHLDCSTREQAWSDAEIKRLDEELEISSEQCEARVQQHATERDEALVLLRQALNLDPNLTGPDTLEQARALLKPPDKTDSI